MFKSCSLDSLYIVRIILTCGTVKFKSHAMFSQTYNSFFRKQNVAFPAGGIMIITSPTVSFLSVFFGYHGIIGGTVFFVSVLLITVQTCPFLALLLLVPHIFIFPHFKYNHCYHNYHYCYHHHHHIISTQITSRQ